MADLGAERQGLARGRVLDHERFVSVDPQIAVAVVFATCSVCSCQRQAAASSEQERVRTRARAPAQRVAIVDTQETEWMSMDVMRRRRSTARVSRDVPDPVMALALSPKKVLKATYSENHAPLFTKLRHSGSEARPTSAANCAGSILKPNSNLQRSPLRMEWVGGWVGG